MPLLRPLRRLAAIVVAGFVAACVPLSAQEFHGMTGLLSTPTAETDSAGTFRGGGFFLHKDFLPSKYTQRRDYNTGGYFVAITAFRWLEASYSATFMKTRNNSALNNEDRHFNVKVTPLYEGRWWPALAVGSDDVYLSFMGRNEKTNYFFNVYAVASKHFDISGYELGLHLAYRYYPWTENKDRRGVSGGVTLRPGFFRPLRVALEWDGVGVNVGADVLLWRHLFAQAILVHGHGFSGGLSYHYTIRF